MKLWGGRFSEEDRDSAEWFTASVDFDRRLYREDIKGSLAHAAMLVKCGIITEQEGEQIAGGLREIELEIANNDVRLSQQHEDIHMNIEALLIEKIGDVGAKLHTARSRNDQVATDMHLFIKTKAAEVEGNITGLQTALLRRAEQYPEAIMPGYTHMQRAQPVLFAHHLLAYFFMLQRDISRMRDCARRADKSPLGCGALAGTSLPIDRRFTADALEFSDVYENSIDGVSDRDFVLEFLSGLTIIMMHLSRLSEELALWAGAEFAFIKLPDSLSTGSSIMPQKRNPDVLELIRGKTGRVYGDFMGMLTVMKGLPLAYNSDMQEDKEGTFDAVDTAEHCLEIMTQIVDEIAVNPARMRGAVTRGFLNATDVADYLVQKGVPFREAHRIVGEMVKYCEERKLTLEDLTAQQLRKFSSEFDADCVKNCLSPETSVSSKNSEGGTSPAQVRKQMQKARHLLRERRPPC